MAPHGMCSAGDHAAIHAKLESLVNRCRRLGYCGRDEPTLSELYSEADDRMFNGVVINPEHVLHQFLTERQQTYIQSPPPAAWQQNSTHKNSIT